MSSSSLALKYRPRTFQDIVGQRPVLLVLLQMLKTGRLPSALVFSGDRGTGKTSTGRILAAALNCMADRSDGGSIPCTVCAHCVATAQGVSPDVYEVDAASHGRVEEIRQLRDLTMYASSGSYRVVLLDEAHSITPQGFNALLKVLEEPPENMLFILLTTEPNKILDTVLSRCMTFEFRRVSVENIVKRLRLIADAEKIPAKDDLLLAIADRSHGGMRDAVMTLDQVSRVGVYTQEDLFRLLGEQDVAPSIISALVKGDVAQALAVVEETMMRTGDARSVVTELITTLKDVLVIHGGGDCHKQGAPLEARQALVSRMTPERTTMALRVMWELLTRVRMTDDPRANLELAVVMMAESLRDAPIQPVNTAPRRLSLDEVRAKTGAL